MPEADGTSTASAGEERKIYLTPEQQDIVSAIKQIDAQLDDLDERGRRLALSGLRGGPIGAGAASRHEGEADTRHADLLRKRQELVTELRQQVGD